MVRQIHNNDNITKLFYVPKGRGLANGLEHYCVLELLHWHKITTDQDYEYLDLSQKDLEIKF